MGKATLGKAGSRTNLIHQLSGEAVSLSPRAGKGVQMSLELFGESQKSSSSSQPRPSHPRVTDYF